MLKVIKLEEYKNYFKEMIDLSGNERESMTDYLNAQFSELELLIENISQETFWHVFPKILGVDAKLSLLTELSPFEDFSKEEIIRIIEMDYLNYFKELCGYDLKMRTKPSLIFNII